MTQHFFQSEARVRLVIDGGPKVSFAVAKPEVSMLAAGYTLRIREATRSGRVFAIRIDEADKDDIGVFFRATAL